MSKKIIEQQVFQLLDKIVDVNTVFSEIEVTNQDEIDEVIRILKSNSRAYIQTEKQIKWMQEFKGLMKELANNALSSMEVSKNSADKRQRITPEVYYKWSNDPDFKHDRLKNAIIYTLVCMHLNLDCKYKGFEKVLKIIYKEK